MEIGLSLVLLRVVSKTVRTFKDVCAVSWCSHLKSIQAWRKNMSEKLWTNLFLCLVVAFLAVFAYFLLNEQDGKTASLIAAGLCLLASRSGDLKKLKVSATGVEAELQSLVEEAKVTIDQLHALATNQSKLLLEMLQGSGRYGGGHRATKEHMRRETLTMLEELGVDAETIEAVKSVEHPYQHFDYCSAVTHQLPQVLGREFTDEQREQWNEFFSTEVRQGIGTEPTPDELEAFLAANSLLNEAVRGRLLDYRQFHETQTHRRRSARVLGSG